VHVVRADLEPGDLVFFYADISHVGIYIGDGMMIDAPDFGQDVMVQPIDWSIYVGAVRIG
jgi:peptidoglycan DL-endopeptidase CwlO